MCLLLLGAPGLALAATPAPGGTGALAAPPAATAAVPANPLVEALPQSWGNPAPAPRPRPLAKPAAKSSTAVVPLPAPKSLARMPVGRVQIGPGRVDARSAMRHSALYVVRAQAAGIVEYLYSQSGLTQMGQPLVRLYDLSILSDLRIGESIMARFASSPFVIAPRQAGLPPLPPSAFPRPTVLQRLLGIRPAPQPSLAPAASAAEAARAQLTPESRPGLARSTGLAPQDPADEPPTVAPAAKATKAPDVTNITRTSSDINAARARIEELNAALSRLDAEVEQAQARLQEARDEAANRERLYNQGVLARNVYEASQKKVQELARESQGLERKRQDTAQARELALQRLAQLQDQLDDQVARQREAAEEEESQPVARRPLGQPGRATLAPNQPRPTHAPARVARRAPAGFPEPTRPTRPELRRLPRLASPTGSSRLVGGGEIPAVPTEVKRLAAPRWLDQAAPTEGLVVRQLVPPGSQVQPGQPLLEVANREFARVYADVSSEDTDKFRRGAPVRITFDGYPGVLLEGWVNDRTPDKKTGLARVEMVVTAREGYYPDDTYASLEWLALAAPLTSEDTAAAVAPATETDPVAQVGPANLYEMMPLVPPQVGPGQDTVAATKDGEFVGVVRMGEMSDETATAHSNPANAARLAKLHDWRDSFTAGMQTGIFGNLILTYPRDDEVARAVERMAAGQVAHVPNMCAGTLREALGWGLGDAAQWLQRLPERGYLARKDGLARPGDILVWPFTYGPRRSQHIGLAVNQGGKLMLLSNLSGTLGTTELCGGYVAFYRPKPKPAQPAVAQTATTQQHRPAAAR